MKKKINVSIEQDKIKENYEIFAIKQDDVIKYIDPTNNKMIIDIGNDVITRENNDYLFVLRFKDQVINIKLKKLNKYFDKKIKTLLIDKSKKSYLVRYLLIDENVINEYYVKY